MPAPSGNHALAPCYGTTLTPINDNLPILPMLTFPQFSPDVFSIGSFTVRWYGVMYLLGFMTAWFLGRRRARTTGLLTPAQFEDALTWGILGVVAGGRLGYVLFYDLSHYLTHPVEVFFLWEGGMSFHGGLLGVLTALFFTSRRFNIHFFSLVDFCAPLVPPGLFFGRIGNFINAELWGKTTSSAWGMVFPGGGSLPRHPSQLYEATLEGLVLFVLLWVYSSKPRPRMAVSGVFAVGYGVFRFFIEFFREPDAHIGYLAFGFLTMGMVLCVPLILVGVFLLWNGYRPARS